jgi:SAM-dependent methyltransferase
LPPAEAGPSDDTAQPEEGLRVRVPEPMVMDEPAAVAAFHRAGSDDGPLVPQYELCARSMSALLRAGGSVIDLGSGSGRYLSYLAERRRDAQIVGVELSAPMIELGERMLAEDGLQDRVRLLHGDMTDCAGFAPARLDLLSCVLALHQLPSAVELDLALRQIGQIRDATGCAVWIWDLVRLEDEQVMRAWLSQTPEADPLFVRDAFASEAAGWTSSELIDAATRAGLADLRHCASQPPLLQAHWAPVREDRGAGLPPAEWHEAPRSSGLRRRVIALRLGFKGLP